MSDQSNRMPVTWDVKKLEAEKAALRDLATKPFLERSFGYIRRTGPGLLQSAMTLGAGSAAASVVAGASFGYKLLWVQPLAMFLGVMMFAAISNIVLTTQERPYRAFMREFSIILVFLWAFATVASSIIWHFPQYGLAAGATRSIVTEFCPNVQLETQGVAREWFGFGDAINDPATGAPKMVKVFTREGYIVSFGIGACILLMNCVVVFNYGRGGAGIRIYEWFLRGVIAIVIVMFAIVVVGNAGKIDWLEMGKGYVGWYGIPKHSDPAEYAKTVTMVLGMLGAAVGINMTFLYPYSQLKKGWGPEHKTLARWDLGMTMFLPFVIVTSLIMLGMTVTNVYTGADVVNSSITPLKAADALTGVLGEKMGRLVFCLGLLGMTSGAISTHMVVCGFTFCEMFGLEQGKGWFRLFALTPAIGYFGVVFTLPFWFPIAASAICFTMLPIAYLIFLVMNNRRSYIGDAVGHGIGRVAFNTILVIALVFATIGATIQIKNRVIDPLLPKAAAVTK
ncbi:MAG: divalent metal cation transporter [Thermoguttaceae bacterium]